MWDPIVIDTCALRDRDFMRWLRDYRGRKILPVVAYTELLVHFVGTKGKTKEQVRNWLRSAGVEIEACFPIHAERAAETGVNQDDFSENARDHLIAAHAHTPPLLLTTYNKKDFRFLGRRVKTPQELMRMAWR